MDILDKLPFAKPLGEPLRYVIDETATCAICGAGAGMFKDLAGIPKMICGGCHSAERQRVLASLYRRYISEETPLAGKRILSVAPSVSERRLLADWKPAHIEFVDARPDTRPDRMVDVCSMPEIASGTFDAVIASGVTACVHDLDAALDEIERVLAPGGIFLHCEVNYVFNGLTEPGIPEKAHLWYGAEAYEKYKVGVFRRVGDLDFIARLQQRFVVKTLYGSDAVNGSKVVWHWCLKRPDALAIAENVRPRRSSRSFHFATNLPGDFPVDRIAITCSVPEVDPALANASFAGHQGDEVFLAGRGILGHSADLGADFRVIRAEGLAGLEPSHCFRTSTGNLIVQTAAWRGHGDRRDDPESWGTILTFDRDWRQLARTKIGDYGWHGTRAIDEARGIVMFAEYPHNIPLAFPEKRGLALAGGPGAELLRPSRVWRSHDQGLTWQVVFELPPTRIRHFHTLVADPYRAGIWYLTSGDLPAECGVWTSRDDGSNWTEISTLDLQDDVPGAPGERQAAYRTTAFDVLEDRLVWIGDDLMTPYFEVTPEAFRRRAAGAHVFTATLAPGPLHPRAAAYLGHPGRSLTDLGPCYLATTEAKLQFGTQSPQVVLISKADPGIACEVMKLPHFGSAGTGLSYSTASRQARNGTFFTRRDAADVVDCGGLRLLRWQVEFG